MTHFPLNTVELYVFTYLPHTFFSFLSKLWILALSLRELNKCFPHYFSACESSRLHSQQVAALLKGVVACCERLKKELLNRLPLKQGTEVYSQQ